MIDRRAALTAIGALAFFPSIAAAAADTDKVVLTDAQWKAKLPPDTFEIMRREGTEPPFSSPLDHEKRAGTYVCAGCALALFSSKTKYESGSGWPSFWRPLPNSVALKVDRSLMEERNEVHCRRCEGHLGHVFDDGPPPTGKRYCMDGVALRFKPGVTA
jgi:peptide-methionine (R)-S-oxide reductase